MVYFPRWRRALLCVLVLRAMAATAGVTVVDGAAIYPESPQWRNGKLFYVEYGGTSIKRWDGRTIAAYWQDAHCGAAGLISYRRTHWLVACYDANTLVEVDDAAAVVRTIERDDDGRPFKGPNDFAADSAGGIYFSASGVYDLAAPISGAVLYLAPDGGVREVANVIHYANGLVVSQDGKTLLVAESLAGRVLAFPIQPDHALGPRTVWARLGDLASPTPNEDAFNGPDGIKLGPDGNYYIAQNGSGRVLVVGVDKKLVRAIGVPTPYVTNVCFGADGAHTVYITGVFDPWKPPYMGAVYRWTP